MNHRLSPAFTLIELLVVIAIVGLLATFGVVQLSGARDKAKVAKGASFSGQALRTIGDDILGRWEFDDCSGLTTADSSGFGNSGTITAASWSTETQNGRGCSLSFNGSTSYVEAPAGSIYHFLSFTTSAWVKTSDAGAGRRRIVSQQDAYNDWWVMALSDNRLEYTSLKETPSPSNAGPLLNDNKWHHVALVRDSGKAMYWYVDGSVVRKDAITSVAPFQMTTPIVMGRHAIAGGGQNFSGLIDEVRVYGRSLTASEMRALYAEGLPRHVATR